MKLLQPNVSTVCNSEVLQVLTERGAGRGRALPTERLAHQYLSSQPVLPLTSVQLQQFFDSLQAYRLTRGELLQLANLAPRTPVEVHLVVADCEARLGEAGVEAVLAAVEARIAAPLEEQEQEPEAGEGGGAEAGEGEGEGVGDGGA
ncbi:hypothetical protein HYH02_010470 [Chlamydomonas schloesseri]|uniref:DNA-directed RNA polymerase III subunit RPC9 n=1 Tax=Chlamydomonas schloesseri TaxID=2026947 RepID=A0A835T6I8_9CHLO|nr:hypothetical protein HYH02_010470 [Chlamydomonas schloesseri]|eukprot:KAG2439837.1 hypothetical protein HYH02_010470 [Chlamydomonas schloesseri]